jgi:hypothetical protein
MITTKATQVQKEEKEEKVFEAKCINHWIVEILLHKERCSMNNKLSSRNTRSLKINISNVQANNNANRKKKKGKMYPWELNVSNILLLQRYLLH